MRRRNPAHPKHLPQVGVPEAEGDVGDVQPFGGPLGLGVPVGHRHQGQRPGSHVLARGPRQLQLGRLFWLHLVGGGGMGGGLWRQGAARVRRLAQGDTTTLS